MFFAIDEAGVEGAAATAIVNGLGFTPSEPPTAEYSVAFDRPFLLLLRDRETGTMLFMGRVTQPTPACAQGQAAIHTVGDRSMPWEF